jgi:deoxyribose-phosphate aldolase
MILTHEELAKMIDHALLLPNMTDNEIVNGLEVAKKYKVGGVCVKPCSVRLAAYHLQGTDIKVGTVISFPHGSSCTHVKAIEAEHAIEDGAKELDMVVNIGKVLSGDWEYVRQDIREVVDLAHSRHTIVKVIFENHYLNDEQKIRLCELCTAAKADFVKTSTGFAETGATPRDVQLMRKYCPPHIQIKAAGGIRTLEQFLQMKNSGASRIGVSATAKILDAIDEQNSL